MASHGGGSLSPTGSTPAPLGLAVREHLDELLRSANFDASSRSREFLLYVVDETLAGRGAHLNQTSIARAVFGRRDDFDAVLDPIVRVQAGRLRRSLERYYLLSGKSEPCRIELPKGSYAPVFSRSAPDPVARVTAPHGAAPVGTADDWPCLLIQPFAAQRACSNTALRFQDQLAQELCRYGDLQVIGGGDQGALDWRAGVRFELCGELRRCADDDLIRARLIDRNASRQLWGDDVRLTAGGSRLGSVDDVAQVMAARIGSEYGVVARTLAADYSAGRLDRSSPSSTVARCYRFFFSRQVGDLVPTLEAMQELTARAPEMALPWVYLARICIANHAFELTALPTPMNRAIPYAYHSVLLDPGNARARCVLASALMIDGEVDAALDELDQALRLNGDSLAYREIVGWLLALCGRWERGVALMRECMDRNPYCLPHVNHGLWADALRRGDLDTAYRAALEYRDPTFFWRDLMLACSLGHLGRTIEARARTADLLQAKPEFRERGRRLIGYFIKPADLRERVIDGLAKAGLVVD
jgi:tetratricopeptide (TPR) repeat protein